MTRRAAACCGLVWVATRLCAAPVETQLVASVQGYFTNIVARLERAAEQQPAPRTFREILRPLVGDLDGFYDASLISPSWKILQVYDRTHFLGVGYDLGKVPELAPFRALMEQHPGPQVSEPAGGGLIGPRLISVRVPVMHEGQVAGIVSLMVRTDVFLEAVGLDRCQAFVIRCSGRPSETRGTLGEATRRAAIPLPATEWVIEYE